MKRHFVALDYIVFAGTLIVSLGIGIYHACSGGKQKTTREFLLANRQMSIFPVMMSLLASFMSAITLLGTPAEIYVYGTQFWMQQVGFLICLPVCAFFYVPVFYKLGLTSVYEYLELRFGSIVRSTAAIAFSFQMLLYMAIVLYAPSLALNAVTGLSVWGAVISVGLVCTFYTTIGGIKAVMWTDVFQVFIMFAGMIIVLIQGSVEAGGFNEAWKIAEKHERIEFFNFNPDPSVRSTFWSVVFGSAVTWISIYGTNQSQVQRAMSCPSLKKAQIAIVVNWFGLTALGSLVCMVGIVVFAFYKDCDPLLNKEILSSDQLVPLFVMETLHPYPGVAGLFVAGIYSGALSTLSSGLNSLAAVGIQDILRRFCLKELNDYRAAVYTKVIAFSYGILTIAFTFLVDQLGGVLEAALLIFGMIGGPVLGVFSLGMFFPWANTKGAFVGLVTSLALQAWIGIGAKVTNPPVPKPPVYTTGCANPNASVVIPPTMSPPLTGVARLYTLSYMWYGAVAVITVWVIGLLVSFATGYTKPNQVNPRLLCPVFDIAVPCLPQKVRNLLQCGIDYRKKHPMPASVSQIVLSDDVTTASVDSENSIRPRIFMTPSMTSFASNVSYESSV